MLPPSNDLGSIMLVESPSVHKEYLSRDPATGLWLDSNPLSPFCRSYLPIHMENQDMAEQVNCLLDIAFSMGVMPDPDTQKMGRRLRSQTRNSWRSALKVEATELSKRGRFPVRWRDLRMDTGPNGYVVRASVQHIHNRVMMRYDITGRRGITGEW